MRTVMCFIVDRTAQWHHNVVCLWRCVLWLNDTSYSEVSEQVNKNEWMKAYIYIAPIRQSWQPKRWLLSLLTNVSVNRVEVRSSMGRLFRVAGPDSKVSPTDRSPSRNTTVQLSTAYTDREPPNTPHPKFPTQYECYVAYVVLMWSTCRSRDTVYILFLADQNFQRNTISCLRNSWASCLSRIAASNQNLMIVCAVATFDWLIDWLIDCRACSSGGHTWMEIQLHFFNAGHNEVPVRLPGQLHMCCFQCFPHEEADFLPLR